MFKTGSRLALLRARTHSAHASIETVRSLARLLAPDLTIAEYVEALRNLHGFHSVMGTLISVGLEDHPDLLALLDGTRARALEDDLAWFGAERGSAAPTAPSIDTPVSALGALYVVEGSSLGGRVIGRHVHDSLGVSPGAGGTFFCALGADAARERWLRLCSVLEGPLERLIVRPSGGTGEAGVIVDELICETAVQTFRCLENWVRGDEVAPDERPLAEAAAP